MKVATPIPLQAVMMNGSLAAEHVPFLALHLLLGHHRCTLNTDAVRQGDLMLVINPA